MENNLNSGDLTKLQVGQTLLTNFRKIKGGKISLELAEAKKGSRGMSATYLFNKSDDRFKISSIRRAWEGGKVNDMEEALGIKLGDDQDWIMDDKGLEILEVNILNPVAKNVEGEECQMRVQIVETTTPDDYQAKYPDQTSKKAGKNGPFILHKGDRIFTNSSIVFHEPVDFYLESDPRVGDISTQTKAEAVEVEGDKVDMTTGEILT